MKNIQNKLNALVIACLALTMLSIGSCSKKSSSPPDNGGGGGPTGPVLIGGYPSSDSVAAANLIAYYPFDGNANDVKGGVTATTSGVTFNTGIRGQAYQGSASGYATLAPTTGLANLQSYSLSVWYNQPAQPSNSPNDPEGMFFLFSTAGNPEILLENEHYAPVAGDSVQLHAGFYNPAVTTGFKGWNMTTFDTAAIGKWVHFVMTYDGPSSTYTVYQDGVAMLNQSTFGTTTPSILYQSNPPTVPANPVGNLDFSSDPPQSVVIGTWPAGLYGVSPTLGSNGCFLGQLDELRVFNKALSLSEIVGLYLNGRAGR